MQHAFIAKHSTVTNLLECTHDWAISLHSKTPVDVIYIDFSRAFDSVVHSKLLVKLETFGICGKLLSYCWYVGMCLTCAHCLIASNFTLNQLKHAPITTACLLVMV